MQKARLNFNIYRLVVIFFLLIFSCIQPEKNFLFNGGRFPGILYIGNNLIIAFWGDKTLRSKTLDATGSSVLYESVISKESLNAGGAIYDYLNNKIYAFSQPDHPPSKSFLHVSSDKGKSWVSRELLIEGNKTKIDLHFSSRGILLKSKDYNGRMIRPARIYEGNKGYSTSIYSDDGILWFTSSNFPEEGTGEGTIVELNDGSLLYSSRRHFYCNPKTYSPYRLFAKSFDGGKTWVNKFTGKGLYDGPRYRNHETPKGPTFQGHYGISAGMIGFELNKIQYLLHSGIYNYEHNWLRKGLVLYLSTDNGQNWIKSRPIFDGASAYSEIELIYDYVNPYDSVIYLFFEGGYNQEYEGAVLLKFNLREVLTFFDL